MGSSRYQVLRPAPGGLEILGHDDDMRSMALAEKSTATARAAVEAHEKEWGRDPEGSAAVELLTLRNRLSELDQAEATARERVAFTTYPSARAAFKRLDSRERDECGGKRPEPWDRTKHQSARGWRVHELRLIFDKLERNLTLREGDLNNSAKPAGDGHRILRMNP
jgi:hypothetical protein